MTLEEKFAEMFPEYVAGSELLSPYWDLFEAGAEVIEQKAKEIIRELVKNSPDTYSGTNIELQQKKMFAFQNAVNKAEQILKE